MKQFIENNKGKLIGVIVNILLMCWMIPWHYYRFKFMKLHNYGRYLIWDDIGGRVVYTIIIVVLIMVAGYMADELFEIRDGI